jgi:hypothetical protein
VSRTVAKEVGRTQILDPTSKEVVAKSPIPAPGAGLGTVPFWKSPKSMTPTQDGDGNSDAKVGERRMGELQLSI